MRRSRLESLLHDYVNGDLRDDDRREVERLAAATFLARDLINTPAEDMGPADLAAAASAVAKEFDARCSVIAGDALLKQKMGESLEEIRSGAFAKEWSSDRADKLELLKQVRAMQASLPMTKWEDAARRAFHIGDAARAEKP